jgi:hypothetical protein
MRQPAGSAAALLRLGFAAAPIGIGWNFPAMIPSSSEPRAMDGKSILFVFFKREKSSVSAPLQRSDERQMPGIPAALC